MAYARGSLKLIAGQTYDPDTPGVWSYRSADAAATVRAANYFVDAKYRQMRAGDLVFVVREGLQAAIGVGRHGELDQMPTAGAGSLSNVSSLFGGSGCWEGVRSTT